MRLQLRQFDVVAHPHIPYVVEPRRKRNFLKGILAVLHIGMVGCYAEANETIGYRELLVHVYHSLLYFAHQTVGRVETRGAGADDRDPQALAIRC